MIQALVKTATPFHWYHRLRRLVNTLLRPVCEPQTSRLRSLTGIAISKPRQILSSRACRGRLSPRTRYGAPRTHYGPLQRQTRRI